MLIYLVGVKYIISCFIKNLKDFTCTKLFIVGDKVIDSKDMLKRIVQLRLFALIDSLYQMTLKHITSHILKCAIGYQSQEISVSKHILDHLGRYIPRFLIINYMSKYVIQKYQV